MTFDFFKPAAHKLVKGTKPEIKKKYRKLQWSVFLSATIGYGLYYVCRLSLNVVKKPLVDEGIFSETEIGIIGMTLFFAYAGGKLVNGFLADRVNIRKFMSIGLFVSALANLILGFTNTFFLFAVLWGLNGWFQSMGAAPSVVGLSRWFSNKERGSFYGYWSSSHNIGEGLTYVVTAVIVGAFGWRWGFWGAALIGFLGVLMIFRFLHDSPQSKGLPAISSFKNDLTPKSSTAKKTIEKAQLEVLKNPAIWVLALSSACMYVARYAINSWGVFYLQNAREYSIEQAGGIIAVGAVAGILGTATSGLVSDKFFNGKRNIPALIFGVLLTVSMSLFLLRPFSIASSAKFFLGLSHNFWIDASIMILFGLAIGVLICFLGGLMAVDIASKKASGAALGVVGIASYIGAALQDYTSGSLIEKHKTIVDGVSNYNFSSVILFWIGASVISFLLAVLVWNAKVKD